MKKLGFGAMRLPTTDPDKSSAIDFDLVCRMADEFMAAGFNYVDTAYMYHGGLSEEAMRRAFVERYPRDSFCLADKLPVSYVKTAEDYPRLLNEQLKRCGVEYFDYYLLHNISRRVTPVLDKTDGFEFLKSVKENGLARRIGFSYHDNAELLDELLTRYPFVEFVQLQLNYADWDSEIIEAGKNYEVCRRHGKEVIVMEPVKGGALARLPEEASRVFRDLGDGLSDASYAIRYAASLEGVIMVLSGMSDLTQLRDNVSYMGDFCPLDEREAAAVDNVRAILKERNVIPCTACGYCVNHGDGCPMNIAIPEYFSIYNTVSEFGHSWSTLLKYRNLRGDGHKAPGDCISCGQCEEHCPQKIGIISLLDRMRDMESLMTGETFKL